VAKKKSKKKDGGKKKIKPASKKKSPVKKKAKAAPKKAVKKAAKKAKKSVASRPVKRSASKKKAVKKPALKKKPAAPPKKSLSKKVPPRNKKSATPVVIIKGKAPGKVEGKKVAETKIEQPRVPKPLTPELKTIRDRLLATRMELAKMLATSQELERNPDDLNFSNEIDLASSLEGREMVFQLASRDRNELRLLDEALIKLDNGTYGVCDGCAKIIGLKRLQILPLTEFCIDCQETLEHQQ
jgi:DnaK suppressor protein